MVQTQACGHCTSQKVGYVGHLRMTKTDVEKSIRHSMSLSPERSVQIIRDSMIEIKDKAFVRSVYRDVDRIAQISGDIETIEFIKELFNDILTH